MEIDEKLKKHYEGNIRCNLCGRELELGHVVDTIQTGMFIEVDDETTMVQYGKDNEVIVLCKNCSPRVKVTVEG